MRYRRSAVVVGVSTAVVGATATGVWAAGSGSLGQLDADGVSFRSTYYKFQPDDVHQGAMYYSGNLVDTNGGDGHNVFVQGKVSGYDYGTRLYSPGPKSQYVWDPAALHVNYGWVQACTDKGTWVADSCRQSARLTR